MDVKRCRCARDETESRVPDTRWAETQRNREKSISSEQGLPRWPLLSRVLPATAAAGVQQFGFFGRGPGGADMMGYHGPRGAPPPTLANRAPNMTLRQICHMLRLMRQVRRREAAAAAAAPRKQAAGLPEPSSPSEKRCLPGFLRRRRNKNIKRVS